MERERKMGERVCVCVSKSQRRKRDESGRGRGVVKVPREDEIMLEKVLQMIRY